MGRLAIAWIAVAACGRVGFDPVTTASDDTPADDSIQGSQGTTGDSGATDSPPSPIANCMYMNCPGTQEACCAAGNTTCVSAGMCVGIVVPCDLSNGDGCPMGQQCCTNGSTAIFCTPALCTP